MKRGANFLGRPAGFTIVETMIVLAVTGLLFASIALSIGGRQAKNAFTQALGQTRTLIQRTASEVGNGYFPDTSNFSCSASGSTITIDTSPAPGTQGKNAGCVFLGKAINFTGSGDPEPYHVYPIAGLQTKDYQPLSNLDPKYVPSIKTDGTLKNGLTTVKMRDNTGSIDAIGFIYSLGTPKSGPGSDFTNGSEQVDVYGIHGTAFTAGLPPAGSLDQNPTGGIQICFKSGGTDQYGLITIGSSEGQLTTNLKIMSQTNCNLP